MNVQLQMVKEFHKKFHVPVLQSPSLAPEDRSKFRYTLIRGEVEEYREGVESGDIENIAKELADMLYSVYGTILEHGLQDVMEGIFEEVHRSNMSKDYHEYKMIKGPDYFKPNLHKFFSRL